MKRLFAGLIAAGLLAGSVLVGTARAGEKNGARAVDEGELPVITVSCVRIREQAPTKEDPGNIHLEGEVMNHSTVPLIEVELRVALTMPDSEEIEVDRRVRVPYNPAIQVNASELLSKSVILPEVVKETLSQRKLEVTVVGATTASP
jgi:hypothetical protein